MSSTQSAPHSKPAKAAIGGLISPLPRPGMRPRPASLRAVRSAVCAAVCALAVFSPALRAQLAPAPRDAAQAQAGKPAPPTPPVVTIPATPADDDIVELSPFAVTAGEDTGYMAQNSLGGSRLKTDYKDIAAPVSIFTEDLLDDLNIFNIDSLANYMLSTEPDFNENQNNSENWVNNTSRGMRMRGLGVSQGINFFRDSSNVSWDRFSTERIEQTRGPNSVLFGLSNPGGLVNRTTKRAKLNRADGYVRFLAHTFDGVRYETDYNLPLIKDTLGIRVAAMKLHEETWRAQEFDDQKRFYGTLKWRPSHKTEINLEGETGTKNFLKGRNITAFDGFTGWIAAGSHLSNTVDPNDGTRPWQIAYDGNANTNRPVIDATPGSPTYGQLMNYRGQTRSAQVLSTDGDNMPITDFALVPPETVVRGPGDEAHYKYSRAQASLAHSFTKDWHLEIAAARVAAHQFAADPVAAAGRTIFADTSLTLPNGQPNPNVGRPYIQYPMRQTINDTKDDALRAMMTFSKDLKKWGRHTLAASFEYGSGINDTAVYQEYIISPNAMQTTQPYAGQNQIFRRTYLGRQLLDGSWTLQGVPAAAIVVDDWRNTPSTGLTDLSTGATSGRVYQTGWIPNGTGTTYNEYRGTTTAVMLKSSFFKNRLNTLFGASYDARKDYNSTQVNDPAEGFDNGFLRVVHATTPEKSSGKSFSGSIVYWPLNWGGLSFSKAQNRGLPDFSGGRIFTPDGSMSVPRMPTPYGRTEDYGVRLNLLDGKIYATLTYFKTSADGAARSAPQLNNTLVNNYIWDAITPLIPNTLSPADYGFITSGNTWEGAKNDTNRSSFDQQTKGWELELFANPTKNFKLRLAYSHSISRSYNLGSEVRAYVERWRELWMQYGSTMTTGNVTVAEAVKMVDNHIKEDFDYAAGNETYGHCRHVATLNCGYGFSENILKGISINADVRYNSPNVIGYFMQVNDATGERVTTQYWGISTVTPSLTLSYKRKIALLGKSVMWDVHLRVDNLFNETSTYVQRKSLNGEILQYRFFAPRSLTIRTGFKF